LIFFKGTVSIHISYCFLFTVRIIILNGTRTPWSSTVGDSPGGDHHQVCPARTTSQWNLRAFRGTLPSKHALDSARAWLHVRTSASVLNILTVPCLSSRGYNVRHSTIRRGSDRQSGNSALVSSSITGIGSTSRYELHVRVGSHVACPKFAIASSHRCAVHSIVLRCFTRSFATQGIGSVSGHATLHKCVRFSSCVSQWTNIRQRAEYSYHTLPILREAIMYDIARFVRVG
jgi:hypothetical protein